ncbi:MAG: large subunit ribosomal protein L19e [archaeon GW2011_AR3]|nr:MAG: large subunit ribosomal protein L19e [archaeon GW2011_AR3]MBS3109354.1 50S ribosomal protein L19e [Candidatus Woesearchaeota archaeon]
MKLNVQKKLAGKILGVSPKRIKLDLARLEATGSTIDDLKQSITKQDIRGFISKGVIIAKQKKGISRGRAKKTHIQKTKGRQRGVGNRKGKKNARLPGKDTWMKKIRGQRNLIRMLKDRKYISNRDYWELYAKAKGGFFRSRRHIKVFMEEHDMVKAPAQNK